MTFPILNGKITAGFGPNFPRPYSPYGYHHGIDVCKHFGAIVRAVEGGKTIQAGKSWGWVYASGKLIKRDCWYIIQEGTYYWAYWHLMSDIKVRVAQEIIESQALGFQQNHLHLGCFKKLGPWPGITEAEERKWSIDPLPILQGGDEMDETKVRKDPLFFSRGEFGSHFDQIRSSWIQAINNGEGHIVVNNALRLAEIERLARIEAENYRKTTNWILLGLGKLKWE